MRRRRLVFAVCAVLAAFPVTLADAQSGQPDNAIAVPPAPPIMAAPLAPPAPATAPVMPAPPGLVQTLPPPDTPEAANANADNGAAGNGAAGNGAAGNGAAGNGAAGNGAAGAIPAAPVAAAATPPPNTWVPDTSAKIRILDKVDGSISDLSIPVGKQVTAGDLQITVMACVQRPPDQIPDAAVFLAIQPISDPGAAPEYSGWMVRSVPAAAVVENASVTFRVVGCS